MKDMQLHHIRHVIMRLALGTVLGWFGVQQALNPADWTHFIPEAVAAYSPITGSELILLHSSLLLLAAAGVLAGAFLTGAAFLAAGLLLHITLSLWWSAAAAHLIVRDLGLLGLAAALALDPVRFWCLELLWRNPGQRWASLSRDAPAPSGSDARRRR